MNIQILLVLPATEDILSSPHKAREVERGLERRTGIRNRTSKKSGHFN